MENKDDKVLNEFLKNMELENSRIKENYYIDKLFKRLIQFSPILVIINIILFIYFTYFF
ncbi:MAG: hypothetical protein JXR48_07300 [Candidatus Delongbacteria bacterium]|nr:hypothetical protein [Candidatus Delongbacteria bacterium]MBN2834757.1 hypothetical protein [Candidatus Delongbacteria bacterium]